MNSTTTATIKPEPGINSPRCERRINEGRGGRCKNPATLWVTLWKQGDPDRIVRYCAFCTGNDEAVLLVLGPVTITRRERSEEHFPDAESAAGDEVRPDDTVSHPAAHQPAQRRARVLQGINR